MVPGEAVAALVVRAGLPDLKVQHLPGDLAELELLVLFQAHQHTIQVVVVEWGGVTQLREMAVQVEAEEALLEQEHPVPVERMAGLMVHLAAQAGTVVAIQAAAAEVVVMVAPPASCPVALAVPES
jgi:hypothetical protein